uniref:Uncharacterized protein n=2 Tax=Bursaphelenchus xylophilus TaxID=6326 RepID=A0A1I7SVM1_BURXY
MVEKVDPVLFLQSLFASSFIALCMTATFLWAMVECGKKPPPPPEEGQPKVAGGYVSKSCNKQTGLLNEDQELNSERLK